MSRGKSEKNAKTRAELSALILHIIEAEGIGDQNQLLNKIRAQGAELTQATLSRWLHKLGVVKENGIYTATSSLRLTGSRPTYRLTVAPPNLLLLHTSPGYAVAAAATIDNLCNQLPRPKNLDGVLGTIAGDDTVLIVTDVSVEGKRLGDAIIKILILGQ